MEFFKEELFSFWPCFFNQPARWAGGGGDSGGAERKEGKGGWKVGQAK